jgi:hypothetical protein
MTCVQHLNREQLLAEIAKRDEDNARLHRENARLEQLLRLMEQKVDGLVRRLFGTSSEKLDPAQLQLLLLELPGIAEGKARASSLQEADPPRAAVEPRRSDASVGRRICRWWRKSSSRPRCKPIRSNTA